MSVLWIDDLGNSTTATTILALISRLDARAGLPRQCVDRFGNVISWCSVKHVSYPLPHPTVAGRYAITIDADAATHLAAIRAAIAAKIAAGTATATETAIYNLPAPSALDGTWQ